MANSKFVHVIYIRTTPEKLWNTLTDSEIMPQYWFGVRCTSEWKVLSNLKSLLETGSAILQPGG